MAFEGVETVMERNNAIEKPFKRRLEAGHIQPEARLMCVFKTFEFILQNMPELKDIGKRYW